MGFNPGGGAKTSVIKSLDNLTENYCSYVDECWHEGCPENCQLHLGDKPHQKRVKRLAEILGYDIRKVFAANAIFIRSKNQNDLQDDSWEFFKRCWPVHELFLSIVQPKIILCLGNGERSSAFAFLRKKLAPNEQPNSDLVKVFSSAITVSGGETIKTRVIGVRHPSYPWFNPTKDLSLYLQKNSNVLTGQ